MLPSPVFVGFSGRRHLANLSVVQAAIKGALDDLQQRTGAQLVAVSSIASGADTLFAEEAARRRLPWLLLLPMPIGEFRADFAAADWARAEKLLPRALSTHVEGRVEERTVAYLECGQHTVDESDVLIAVWDGQKAAGVGGTGDVVAYARSLGKPVWWIHERTGELVRERAEKLAPSSEPPNGAGEAGANGHQAAAEFLAHCNARAKALRPQAMNISLMLILSHQLATAVAIAALVWAGVSTVQSGATITKLAILGAAIALPLILRRAHRGWVHARIEAEITRSALQLWPLSHPEETFAVLRLPGFERLQRSLLLMRLQEPSVARPFDEARRGYLERRIDDQQRYFNHASDKARRRTRMSRRWALACSVGAIACGASLATGWPAWGAAYPWVKLAALTLPLVTAAIVGTILALDYGRRAARYGELADYLAGARVRIEHATTAERLSRLAAEVERTLMFEVWEWYSLARFAFGGH